MPSPRVLRQLQRTDSFEAQFGFASLNVQACQVATDARLGADAHAGVIERRPPVRGHARADELGSLRGVQRCQGARVRFCMRLQVASRRPRLSNEVSRRRRRMLRDSFRGVFCRVMCLGGVRLCCAMIVSW